MREKLTTFQLRLFSIFSAFKIIKPAISRWVDTKIKGEVNKYTEKESYQFGDLTKEIMRRVATGQYTLDDLFMLLKALAVVQASISPIGKYGIYGVFIILTTTMDRVLTDPCATCQILVQSWLNASEIVSTAIRLFTSQ